jgi:hypothetical protein
VAPPRRINPAKLKQISVGTLAFIPSNSHKLQFLLTAITLSMKHISIKAPQAEATGRVYSLSKMTINALICTVAGNPSM